MKMHRLIIGSICSSLLMAGSVLAELRVLFSFDGNGVRIHRVIELESEATLGSDSSGDLGAGLPPASAVREGEALLQWRNAAGDILEVTQVSDPRVTQSPDHADGSASRSRLGLSDGGFVASGPNNAVSVVVELPEKPSLGLPLETWTLSLTETKR